MAKLSSNKYSQVIKHEYCEDITPQNYHIIINDLFRNNLYKQEYFNKYINENKKFLNFRWGCLMYLFIKAFEAKIVGNVYKYYNKLTNYPPNYYCNCILGQVELRYYGNMFKAKKFLKRAIELAPCEPESYYELGFVYNLLGVCRKSLECYESALKYYGNALKPFEIKARSLFNIAVNKMNLYEDYSNAVELMERALIEMPDYPQALKMIKEIKKRKSLFLM